MNKNQLKTSKISRKNEKILKNELDPLPLSLIVPSTIPMSVPSGTRQKLGVLPKK